MTQQQLKEEARKEMCSLLNDHEIGFGEGAITTNILDFIDSLITQAYEEGNKEEIERLKRILKIGRWALMLLFLWHFGTLSYLFLINFIM